MGTLSLTKEARIYNGEKIMTERYKVDTDFSTET